MEEGCVSGWSKCSDRFFVLKGCAVLQYINGKERINNYLTRKPTSAFSLPYIPVDFQTYLFIDKTYASVFNTSLDIIQTEITTTLILVTL